MPQGIELFFHLRKPAASLSDMKLFLDKLSAKLRPQCILHQHLQLANDYGLAGIHRNTKNGNEFSDARRDGQIASFAAHTLSELSAQQTYDYYWLSPIFDSISKQGYQSNFSETELHSYLQASEKKVIALGGITDRNAAQCIAMGFAGVAVLGWFWQYYQTEGAASLIKQLKKIAAAINLKN